MINVFQLAANDQSVYYLGKIFGNVGIALAGTGPALLATMFKTFNTALLVIGTFIVAYTTIIGVVKTASEGKFLGEKWNSLWVPLRTVMGIAALIPTKAGYCAIQVIIMWVIVQGIGAADMVWKSAVEYLKAGGAISSPGWPKDIARTAPKLMKQLFADLVCQAAVVKFVSNQRGTVAHSFKVPNTFTDKDSSASFLAYTFGREPLDSDPKMTDTKSECGVVAWGRRTTQGDPEVKRMEASQTAAMDTIVPVLEKLADRYVVDVINNKKCWKECDKTKKGDCKYFGDYSKFEPMNDGCGINSLSMADAWDKLSTVSTNFMGDAIKLFGGYAYNYSTLAALEEEKKKKSNPQAGNPYDRAIVNGWIFAGAYYYYFTKQGKDLTPDYNKFIGSVNVNNDNGTIYARFSDTSNYWDFYSQRTDADGTHRSLPIRDFYCYQEDKSDTKGGCKTADEGNPKLGGGIGIANMALAALIQAATVGGGFVLESSSGAGQGGGPASAMGDVAHGEIRDWVETMSGTQEKQNPLVAITSLGQRMLSAGQYLFWSVFGVMTVLAIASVPVYVWGYGNFNIFSGVANFMQSFFLPIVYMLLAYFFTVGGMLGVYIPLIPYTFFTFGVIGWLLAVVDAMVAAPLLAIGIMSPGGQSDLLGRAEPGLMILMNVFLRPTLMIFGMMASMLLSYVVVIIINSAFYNVVISIRSSMGLIEALIYVFAYAGLIIAALNKCFTLIYMLPDQTLRWIGGHAETIGEKTGEAGVAEMKAKTEAGSKGAADTTKGAMQAQEGAISGAKNYAKEKKPPKKPGGQALG